MSCRITQTETQPSRPKSNTWSSDQYSPGKANHLQPRARPEKDNNTANNNEAEIKIVAKQENPGKPCSYKKETTARN
jgi:hypothetical protein